MKNLTNSFLKKHISAPDFNKTMLSLSVLSVSLLASQAYAFDVEHEAHVHGHASLNIAAEGKELHIAFKSPAMNIVGFEHDAKSKQDKEKVKHAVTQLKNGASLFGLTGAAGCEFEGVQVSSALMDMHNDHHDEHDHDKHHDDHHDEHDHEKHHDDHHDEHGHEDHGDEHSEFEAEYHFECKNINKLNKMNVALFKVFPSLEEVEAQVLLKNKQTLVELNENSTVVELK